MLLQVDAALRQCRSPTFRSPDFCGAAPIGKLLFLTLLILVNEPLLCDPSFHKNAHARIIRCARTTRILAAVNERLPSFQLCLCFTPLEAERCASVASSPSLWPGRSSPLPGPICFHAPRFVEPAETMHGARAHAAAASRTAERQNLRLSRHPVTSLAANARFRQPTLLNQD